MSNPVNKYLEKKAGIADFFRKAKEPAFNALVGGALMGAMTAAANGSIFGAKKIYEAITKHRDFRMMLEHNQDLKAELDKDPKFFNQAYSSLRSVNPEFASDPLIAGHYMRQMTDAKLHAGGHLTEALRNAPESPILQNTMRGMMQGAASGMNRLNDPHAEMAQQVRGLELQDRHNELTAPMEEDPFENMRRETEENQLRRQHAESLRPIYTPINQRSPRRPPTDRNP